MSRHVVCRAEELASGERRIVEFDRKSIGIFNVGGSHFAIRNACPHQGGPLCAGTVGGTMLPSDPYRYVYGMEDRVIRCPWHGWEFDMETGRALFDPKRRVKTYPVTVEDGALVIDI